MFGDVIAAIETGLENIFGKIHFEYRMNSYNPRLGTIWNALKNKDFGHVKGEDLAAKRVMLPEVDQHGKVFGIYGKRPQWELCEIVCTNNFNGETEERRIFSARASGGQIESEVFPNQFWSDSR